MNIRDKFMGFPLDFLRRQMEAQNMLFFLKQQRSVVYCKLYLSKVKLNLVNISPIKIYMKFCFEVKISSKVSKA